MADVITKAGHALADWFKGLTGREKQGLAFMAIVLGILVIYVLAGNINSTFSNLDQDLTAANEELTQVSTLLTQYSKVKAQRDRIENEFRSVEFKEGELTYLEDLIRRKLGLTGGFSITPKGVSKFGANYEQHLFTVKFAINDLKLVMDFLNDIVSGPQPLLLTRLDIKVTRNGESLDIDMDVSSIKEVRA